MSKSFVDWGAVLNPENEIVAAGRWARKATEPMRRATSVDIARQAGVSQTTVSFVLNGRKDVTIPKETRDRVLRVARELNYVPHAYARGLVSGRTRAIGVSAGRSTDPHYTGLLDDLHRHARERGYHLVVISGHTDTAPKLLAEGHLDGVLVIGDTLFQEDATKAQGLGLPMAFVGLSGGHAAEVRPKYLVGWDDRSGAAEVARHLLGLGHQRLAILAGAVADSNDKIAGFLQAAREAGFEPFIAHCGSETDPYAAGQQMLRELLQKHPEVTAVFCRNDLLAIGALSMASQLGVRVPEQLSVAGYSNVPMSAYTIPPLTTVATPIREAGRNALEILLAGLEGEEAEQTEIQFPVTLVCRQSTGPARLSEAV